MNDSRPLRSTRRLQNVQGTLAKWYSISNTVAGKPTQVTIYDEIGMFGVAAGPFLADVDSIPGDIEMHINSPGGDIYEAITIYNRLKNRKGNVHVVVDGLAASAASFIAMAASPDMLEMAPRSELMIHNGFTMAIGDAADLRKTADLLDQKTQDIAGIYADRSGKPAAYWLAKMADETWFTAEQAVEEGLADNIQGQNGPKNAWDLSVYNKYDPDHDGDDDSTAEGDTDHDYVEPDGSPGPKAAGDKYKQADRDRMAKSGQAMPDGSYPIADEEDLGKAIKAVGRGNADHDGIRKHIIERARALGLESKIPGNWNADGSLKDLINVGALSAFLTTHMAQERSRA